MAEGLYILDEDAVMVAYGKRTIAVPKAQYRANGYKPPLESLAFNPASAKLAGLKPAQPAAARRSAVTTDAVAAGAAE